MYYLMRAVLLNFVSHSRKTKLKPCFKRSSQININTLAEFVFFILQYFQQEQKTLAWQQEYLFDLDFDIRQC